MSIAKYSSYKKTIERWVTHVPEHWHMLSGKRLFSNIRVRALKTDEQLAASQAYGVIPQSLMIKKNDAKVMLALKGTESFRHVDKNDFVISLRSFEGGIEHSEYTGCVSPAYTVLKPREFCSPEYFRHLLKSDGFISALQSTTDSLRDGKSISYEQFGSITLPCPPLKEQTKIAQFLDYETAKIDALIDEQKRLIELLKEKRQAVISHAVTKGLNPDAPMKDSGVEWLGEVPEHWRVAPLKWFSTIRGGIAMGKRYDSDEKLVDCPYLRVANVQSGHFNFSEIKTVKVTHSEAIKFRLKFGEVLMNEGGDNDKLGRGAIWRDDIPNCLHQNHVFAINIETGLLPEWLATFTESSSARAYFYLYSKQSTNLASISSSNVASCLLPIPPKDEQKSILSKLAQEVDAIDNLNNESIKMMEMLKERRSALISAAVTGKIDVRDWQPPAGSDTVDSNALVQTERHYG